MEQLSRQNEFIKKYLAETFKLMNIDKEFIEFLSDEKVNPFVALMGVIQKFGPSDKVEERLNEILKQHSDKDKEPSEIVKQILELFQMDLQKLLLLMVFAREREPVDYLSTLMRRKGQSKVADNLVQFNKSENLIDYEFIEYLEVRPSTILMCGTTRFDMDRYPRGYCLIIVNEPKLVSQAKQVGSVFSQLLFKVDIKENQKKGEIEKLFSNLTSNEVYKDNNALVTYLLGHGSNGYFATPDGEVSIPELLNNCAEDKDGPNYFKNKPKVHIFDCCRNQSDSVLTTLWDSIKNYRHNWFETNINTTVIYSCAKGEASWYYPNLGYSLFGLAFTHSIAQYACEKDINGLMQTVHKRLEKYAEEKNKTRTDKNKLEIMRPEVINYAQRWELYFNPGIMKNEKNEKIIIKFIKP